MKSVVRVLWLLLFLIINTSSLRAQIPKQLDSLKTFLKNYTARDTIYARAQAEYAYKLLYEGGEVSQADSVARLAEALSHRLRFGPGVYKAIVTQGGAQFERNKPEEAIRAFRRLAGEIERYKMPPVNLLNTWANIGAMYRSLGQTKEALTAAMRAADLETRHNIRPRNENLRRTLGFLFILSGEKDKAVHYLREGIAVAAENKDPNAQATLEVDLGNFYIDQANYTEAIKTLSSGLAHSREGGYQTIESDALRGLGSAYYKAGQLAKGFAYARQSLQLAQKLQFKYNIAASHYILARIYQSRKQYAVAETEMLKASALVQEAGGGLNNYELYTEGLAELAALQGKYRQAYVYQRRHETLRDSVMSEEQKTRTDELVARYENAKKEAQIKLLRQETQLRQQETDRTRLLLAGAVLLLLSLSMTAAWLLNRARLRRLEDAQQLRKQIAQDLHDEVGSTLSSISLLSGHTDTLLTQNRPEKAQQMVQKIYGDARQILESIDEIIWTINPGNDSLQRIALRLQEYAQPLMESKNIRFSFQIDPTLEGLPISMEVRRNLYLIGKEAINNLVKYAQATEATVRFDRKDNRLQVLIEDNGRGFVEENNSTRNGQQSMKDRAEAMGGSLEVQSAPERGTRLQLVVGL